jgi:hypothetical protein
MTFLLTEAALVVVEDVETMLACCGELFKLRMSGEAFEFKYHNLYIFSQTVNMRFGIRSQKAKYQFLSIQST